jgi:hypothetical protein
LPLGRQPQQQEQEQVNMQLTVGFKVLWAQLGTTSGRKVSVPMLLNIEELSWPDWRLENSWTFRPAIVGMADSTDLRSRENGSAWAIRSFVRFASSQWLTLRVLPMISQDDACSWIDSLGVRVVKNEHATSVITDRTANSRMQSLNLECSNALRYRILSNRSQQTRDVKCVAGNIGNILFVIRCAGLAEGWSWDDVLKVAGLQSTKIARVSHGVDQGGV